MPTIREYTSQVDAPGPVNQPTYTGADFGALQGRGMQELGQAVGQLSEHLEEAFVKTKVANALSKAQKELEGYADELENGSVGPDGVINPPKDPLEREALFDARVKKLSAENKHPLWGNIFDASFEKVVAGKKLQLRKNNLDAYKQGIDVNITETLNRDAQRYVDAYDLDKAAIKSEVLGTINAAEKAGVYDAKTAQKKRDYFEGQITSGTLFKWLKADPAWTQKALLEGTFPKLTQEERKRWIEHAEAEEKRQSKAGSSVEDKQLLAQLEYDAGNGKDVRKKAMWAYNNNKISEENFKGFMRRHDGNPNFRLARQFLQTSLQTTKDTNSAQQRLRGRQEKELELWFLKHPEASLKEALTHAELLVDEVRRTDTREVVLKTAKPRYLVGPTNNPDIKATLIDTKKAWDKKELTKEEYDEQLILIRRIEDTYEARLKEAEAANKKNP